MHQYMTTSLTLPHAAMSSASPLHDAVEANQFHIISALVAKGIDVNGPPEVCPAHFLVCMVDKNLLLPFRWTSPRYMLLLQAICLSVSLP